MKLKFIGEDGSLGLRHGRTYEVTLRTAGKYLWTYISKGPICKIGCPYASLQAFAANLELEGKHD